MAQKINSNPLLPRPPVGPAASTRRIAFHLLDLTRSLQVFFGSLSSRVNGSLPKDGSEAMTSPLPLEPVAVADLPAAADWPGALAYVTDETGGAVPAWSDGSDWRRVTDGNVVSA